MNKFNFGIILAFFVMASTAFAGKVKTGDKVFYDFTDSVLIDRTVSYFYRYERYRAESTVLEAYSNGKAKITLRNGKIRIINMRQLHKLIPSYNGFKVNNQVHGNFSTGFTSWTDMNCGPRDYTLLKVTSFGSIKNIYSGGWASVRLTDGSTGYSRINKLFKEIPSFGSYEKGSRVFHEYGGDGTVEAVYSDGGKFFPKIRARVKYDKNYSKTFPLLRKLRLIGYRQDDARTEPPAYQEICGRT